ncbi:hypothetical protein Tsubulata_012593 [Turnera subulata]|uniref:acetyl-CoA carboxytransferase n=1 Tax=Turnera subulata TaxID=218843 RepID=A0A9Q0FQK9_9ROSI|nr:hypothetical protein Tsubulata_012593 [Turnera subulata]
MATSLLHSSTVALSGGSASDLLRSSSTGVNGIPLKRLGRAQFSSGNRGFSVVAKFRKSKKKYDYPWPKDPDPNVKGGILRHLSNFKPLQDHEKPKPVVLDFERPLVKIDKQIAELEKLAEKKSVDFSEQISSLKDRRQEILRESYLRLTPIQRVYIARHPHRPTFLDHVFNITERFVELHGDRAGYDDPAIVCGLGTMDGQTYMFIGHQKGRNTKEHVKRNFGMPTPHGYRKALRFMNYADHHGFPIITFCDTPGAFADLKSEYLGQGEAIARNIRDMFGLKVPIVSIVIGEGGSGGALAIACANKLLMLENAVFYVASPEASAAILWKTAKAAPKAARKLKITARELFELQIADGVIPEPLGGAHTDPLKTSQRIKNAITKAMNELENMDTERLLKHRNLKFRQIGRVQEGVPLNPRWKNRMKKTVLPPGKTSVDHNWEREFEKIKQQMSKPNKPSRMPTRLDLDELMKKLKEEIDNEYSEAVKTLGFGDRFSSLLKEISNAELQGQPMDPVLQGKMNELNNEFGKRLSKTPGYASLKSKLGMLKELSIAKSSVSKGEQLKVDIREEELRAKVAEKIKEIFGQSGIKEKIEKLRAEIKKLSPNKFGDINQETRENIMMIKREIELEIEMLKSMDFHLDELASFPQSRKIIKEALEHPDMKAMIDALKASLQKIVLATSGRLNPETGDLIKAFKVQVKELAQRTLFPQVEAKESLNEDVNKRIEEFYEEVNQKIEDISNVPEVRSKMEQIFELVKKRRTKAINDALKVLQEHLLKIFLTTIKSEFEEQYKQLQPEISAAREFNGGLDGNLKNSDIVERSSVEAGASRSLA